MRTTIPLVKPPTWHCTVGAMVAMMQVLVLPPRESRRRRVSFESRYGMCPECSTSVVITRPRVSRLWIGRGG